MTRPPLKTEIAFGTTGVSAYEDLVTFDLPWAYYRLSEARGPYLYDSSGNFRDAYINDTGGTNLVTNPDFDTVTTGWTAIGGATISRDTVHGYATGTGTASLQIVCTGIGSGATTTTGAASVTPGTAYRASMWVYSAAGGQQAQIFWDELSAGGATLRTAVGELKTLVAGWQPLTMTATMGASADKIKFYVKKMDTGAATIWIDDCEVQTTAVTYGATGAITGEPSDTAITFPAANIEFGTWNGHTTAAAATFGTVAAANISIEAWIKTTVVPVANMGIAGWGDAVPFLLYMTSTGKLAFTATVTGETTAVSGNSAASYNDGAYHHVVGTYSLSGSAEVAKIYVDGVLRNSSSTFVGGSGGVVNTASSIGFSGSGNANFVGTIDEVAHYTFTLSAAQILAHYNARTSLPFFSTWTDVSSRVKQVSIRRGRQNELDTVQAGTAAVVFTNNDRALDPSNTASAYYPNVLPMKPIRISASNGGMTDYLYTGLVERWQMDWTPGPTAEVVATCVDGFEALSHANMSTTIAVGQSKAGQQIFFALSEGLWPLNKRALAAGQYTMAAVASPSGTVLSFIQGLSNGEGGVFFISGAGDAVFLDSSTILTATNLVSNGEFESGTVGWLKLGSATISRSLTQAHVGVSSLSVVTTGAGDGAIFSGVPVTPNTVYTSTFWFYSTAGGEQVFLQWDETDASSNYLRTVNDSVTKTLSAGWQSLSMSGTTGVNTGLLNIYWTKQNAGAATVYNDTVSVASMTPVFGDGPGEFGYQTLGADLSTDFIFNDVSVTPSSAVVQQVKDTTSQGVYFPRPTTLSTTLLNNADALARANALLAAKKDPHLRFPGALVFRPQTDREWAVALSADINTRITVRRRPPGGGPALSADYLVEAIAIDITPGDWAFAWQLSPAP